jgi:hypothetical protein
MTTIQAQVIGDCALMPRTDLERLLEIARRSEAIDLQLRDDEANEASMVRLSEAGGSFDFWNDSAEDIYSPDDGEAVQ